jgi:hypothetical protein
VQKSLARADEILIDQVCQPPVDWIGHRMSIDCFRLASFCTDLSAIAWILSQAGPAATAARTGHPGFVALQFTLLVLGLAAIVPLRALFRSAGGGGRAHRGGQANPLRGAMYTHRIACLLWLTALLVKTATASVGLESLALLAVGAFATMAVYVAACSTPPPKQRDYEGANWVWWYSALRRGSGVAVL